MVCVLSRCLSPSKGAEQEEVGPLPLLHNLSHHQGARSEQSGPGCGQGSLHLRRYHGRTVGVAIYSGQNLTQMHVSTDTSHKVAST